MVFLRIFWRLINPMPTAAKHTPLWQKSAAKIAHYALYVLMIIMPLSGWLMSSAAGFPVSVFGLFTLPDLIAPNNGVRMLMEQVHTLIAYAIIALVSIHILAALKHHFIDKDNTLRRILPVLVLFSPALLHAETQPQNWYIQPAESSITFTATQNNAPIKGRFANYGFSIYFSPENLENSSVNGEIDIGSLMMDYPDAVKTALSTAWLDAGQFKIAKFKTTSISHLAKNNYAAEGELTMLSKTIPIILHFTLEEYTPKLARVKGEASLSRSAFGIGKGEWAATDVIKDEGVVNFDILARDNPPFTPPPASK
jgi:polyisoprenoid-binding protein YceI